MINTKQTPFYKNVLKEIKYPFGDIFIFDGFVVSEINEGVHVSWEKHTKLIVNDVLEFTGGDYEDEEIRLYRIKFMSEVAN